MPIRAAFDQGQPPTIAFVNQATVSLGVDMSKLVAACQRFTTELFAPIWGTPATLVEADAPHPGMWTMVFLDDADAAGALGYHDLTVDKLPISKVFVKTTLQAGEVVSVTACHELCEMLVDPAINLWAQKPNGRMWAYEMCDAVEEENFDLDGVLMSDFVTPAYFEGFREAGSARFDYLKKVNRPNQLLHGGYSIISVGGQIRNIYGSLEKAERFAREDRRLHRSNYRKPLRSETDDSPDGPTMSDDQIDSIVEQETADATRE